ncbi:MAG: hypothetical protein KAV68_04855 [Dehalococcoidales bacterium]|nr:hypothetical protein [Dehalococcoidales bacterium]
MIRKIKKLKPGTRIKVIEMKNREGKLKYPESENFIGKYGKVLKLFDVRMTKDEKFENWPSYKLEMDDGEVTILHAEVVIEAR